MQKIEIPTDFLENYKKARASDIVTALELLQQGCKFSVKKEIKDDKGKKTKKIESFEADQEEIEKINKLIEYLNRKTDDNLLTAPPNKLRLISDDIGKISDNLQQVLKFIFDYEKIKEDELWSFSINKNNKLYRKTAKNGDENKTVLGRSKFLKKLKVQVCPYCNIHFVNHVDSIILPPPHKTKKKTLNPALDHYYPHSLYPYLAISLYNLIPACTYCNTNIKGDAELNHNDHLHPYEHSFHKKAKFSIKPTKVDAFYGNTESFDIEVYSNSDKALKTSNFFGLKDRYQQHKDYASEILAKKQMYNDDWAKSLSDMFPNLTSDDALRYYYGNYTDEKNINQRPLSKLTIDIIDQFDN